VSRISPPTAESPAGLPGRVRGAVRTLNPGYLALVMATGIVSVAMSEHGVPGLSLALLWLAAACYAVLVVLYAWRLVSYRAEVGADLRDPARAFGFFTIVAGTEVPWNGPAGDHDGTPRSGAGQ
jgi:Voltage-dependent anion channel